jgi:aldose 1-epimerase
MNALAGLLLMAASAQTSVFGTAETGEVVRQVTLTNAGGMVVRFSARGGTITTILAPDRDGVLANVVLGKPDFAAWEKAGSFNSVVGRYANRISGGGFSLDGKFYSLVSNPANGVAIHGGPGGFASKLWEVSTFERRGETGAVLRYTSPDGENGYPGTLVITMTYSLTDAGVFRIDYLATTDKPTIINLTNHSYFNLGGAASGPVYGQRMQVLASRYTPTDTAQVPTGGLDPVKGTPFDFRTPTSLGTALYRVHPQLLLAKGIDHNFVLDAAAGALAPAVRLHDPVSGRQLEVRTTEPGVQIYTGNYLNGTELGADGRVLRQSDGIAFETQHFPDSPNKPQFPTTVLRPGETFRSTTEFAFSTDKTPFWNDK